MKKLILIILLGISLFASELKWLDDFEDAKYFAKKENKLVMMFISSPTCHICN
jgi:thioredoxin-related protein